MTVKLKRGLYGPDDPRGPTRGSDVPPIKRGLNKIETDFFPRPPAGFDEVYNAKTAEAVKVFQRLNDIKTTGHFGQDTLDALWPYMDAYARYRYRRFKLPRPPSPPLVQPVQGFNSLDDSLWQAYSLGRRMGMSDLGTYNPVSTLPSGGPSDHAVNPAFAFDLGISPTTGWQNDTGRAFFEAMVARPEVSYVILGDKIWSRARASEGIRPYTSGGHENHCHVSGVR